MIITLSSKHFHHSLSIFSWSGKKKKGGPNREVNERQRMTHKIKREMKAAVREIKRDNEVLATHQLEVITKKYVMQFIKCLNGCCFVKILFRFEDADA